MRLGTADILIRAKTGKLARDLAKAKGMTAKTSVLMQQEIGRISFAHVGVAALAFSATVAFGMKKAIDAASDLEETVGKFNVVFADHGKQAEDMSNVLVNSYAMSTREAKQYLSSVQDLLVPMGMASDEAIKMSFGVAKLAADLGSFNNQPTEKVMLDIQSALVGNFETMKKYGVVLNETVIKAEALSKGLWNGKGMVDANTKAQIAYSLMLKGSAAAIGDQERTMGSYANQIKQLKANIENISAAIGDELLPSVTAWVNQINVAIKQNPQMIKQVGELAKNILDLATTMGKVIGFGAEFANVWIDTIKAIGLAAGGVISFKTALLGGGVDAVYKFGSELGRSQLQAQKLRTELSELETWREFWSNKEHLSYAQKSKQLKMLENQIKNISKAQADSSKSNVGDLTKKNNDIVSGDNVVVGGDNILLSEMQGYAKLKDFQHKTLNDMWRFKAEGQKAANEEAERMMSDEYEAFKIFTDTKITYIKNGYEEMIAAAAEFGRSIDSAFESSMKGLVKGLADGSKSIKDIASDLLSDLADSFLDYAMSVAKSQLIASQGGSSGDSLWGTLFSGILGGLTSGGGGMVTNPSFTPGGAPVGFADGGISTGPSSGHMELLHGTEAVIPLKGGAIPVQSTGASSGSEATTNYNITIQAIDSKSLAETLKRNPEAIIGPISDQANKGNSGLKSAINKAGR